MPVDKKPNTRKIIGVLENIIPKYINNHKKWIVAYSGGVDSHVLLHALCAIKDKYSLEIKAIHVDHNLSPNSNAWQEHCSKICKSLNIEYKSYYVYIKDKRNLENTARKKRYKLLFSSMLKGDILLTAHHLDDQVETFFLRLFRGSGLLGLTSIKEYTPASTSSYAILRAFLSIDRASLNAYAKENNLNFVQDETNENTYFDRNLIRHNLIPLIKSRWPQFTKNIYNTTILLQNNYNILERLLGDSATSKNHINIPDKSILGEPIEISKFQEELRLWLASKEVNPPTQKQIQEILKAFIFSSSSDASPVFKISDFELRRHANKIYLVPPLPDINLLSNIYIDLKSIKNEDKTMYGGNDGRYNIETAIGSLRLKNSSNRRIDEQTNESNTKYSIILPEQFYISYRKGGENILLHGQTHSIKKLLQTYKNVPSWIRPYIPIIYDLNHTIVALIVFDKVIISDDYYAKQTKEAFSISWSPGYYFK